MKLMLSKLAFALMAIAAAFTFVASARAQVAGGTTTVDLSVTESTQLAMGWSVKKTLLGKTVYNDFAEKVGKVDDLIVSPDKSLSYVIVGAGGFLSMGRHDVAIQVSQIQLKDGKLVMAGATKDMIKSMPAFTYASDTTRRDQFVAAADKDIAKGKATAVRWKEFEAGVSAATARLRKSIDTAIG